MEGLLVAGCTSIQFHICVASFLCVCVCVCVCVMSACVWICVCVSVFVCNFVLCTRMCVYVQEGDIFPVHKFGVKFTPSLYKLPHSTHTMHRHAPCTHTRMHTHIRTHTRPTSPHTLSPHTPAQQW